jgi:cyclopropane fatty-acyl-phospholipid synthase-like methyltransferase
MSRNPAAGYNQRLFGPGIRGFFHTARFRWLQEEIRSQGIARASVLELGCFDGKTIDYLPFEITRYVGLDANWEAGLSNAQRSYRNHPSIRFHQCRNASEIPPTDPVDVFICMETLEHIASHQTLRYLEAISRLTTKHAFFTVPCEIGPVFLAKHAAKRILNSHRSYTSKDLFFQFVGATHRIKTRKAGHKGFSHRRCVRVLSEFFDIEKVVGIPFGFLPPSLNFTVGISARV